MSSFTLKLESLKAQIKGGLIVSCQAPAGSPLGKPEIISALAETAEQNGAVAVRIDAPENIRVVRSAITLPIFGIYKLNNNGSKVYITPTTDSARQIALAGADVIAVDATTRERPNGESLDGLCKTIRDELGLPVMADVSTLEEGVNAESLGCDFVGTTLSGYTDETSHLVDAPDFDLIEKLASKIQAPIICEGRLQSSEDVKRAFDCGAFAVVVGGAITGVDLLVKRFVEACPKR